MDIYFIKETEKVVLPNTFMMENPLAKKRIRPVASEDYPALLSVYSYYITDTTVTFEYEVPSVEEFSERISQIARDYPVLVLEVDGYIVGYAYATTFKPRVAYQWVAETVIYLRPDFAGQRLGRMLYEALIGVLKLQNVYQGIAVITSENQMSIDFHQKMGFKVTSRLEKVGYKFGKWLDVCWMQIGFEELPSSPDPIKPAGDIYKTEQFQTLITDINNRLNSY